MNIQEYMEKAERIGPSGILFDMPALFAASLAKRTFPPPLPLPENLNAASLSRAGVLNGQRLELHALAHGLDRSIWLSACDAAFLGLETTEPLSKPLTLISNTRTGHTTAQTVYVLDQFSSPSRDRMCSLANPGFNRSRTGGLGEALLFRRNAMAGNAVYALSSYDSGLGGEAERKHARNHLQDNSRPGKAGFAAASHTYALYTSSLPHEAHPVFDFLRRYYTQQLSGAPVLDKPAVDTQTLIRAMKTVSENRELVIKTFFYAKDFAKRLVRPSFSVEYSQSIPAPAVITPIKPPPRRYRSREGR